MNQATLAWAAFRKLLRMAARDPLWAVVSLIALPFRVSSHANLGTGEHSQSCANISPAPRKLSLAL